jgi:hypothetical protein
MPSSDLAYKALYTALDARSKRADVAQLHADVFVETSGPSSTTTYMFLARTTTTGATAQHFGVFANVDKRAATAPRIDTIPTDDVTAFLAALPAIALAAPSGDQLTGGATYEVRVRDHHVDVTMHFANPRPPREDLVALAGAIRELITLQTS